MDYDLGQLAPRGAARTIFDSRPTLTQEAAQGLFDRLDLGEASCVKPLGPYVINSVHRVDRVAGPPIVFKGQHRFACGWTLGQEATALGLLGDHTSLLVPSVITQDLAGDLLGVPFLLLSWMEGDPTLDIYEAADPPARLSLATQLGQVVGSVHRCPLPDGIDLPTIDLRDWRKVVRDALFGEDGLRAALERLAPELPDEIEERLARARGIGVDSPLRLEWRDASFHNTTARGSTASPEICGVFDFQSAVRSHGYTDFRTCYSRLTGSTWKDDPVETPEWSAFQEGYGRSLSLRGPEYHPTTCTNPALQVRHWWDILGQLHRRTPEWLDELLAALSDLARPA